MHEVFPVKTIIHGAAILLAVSLTALSAANRGQSLAGILALSAGVGCILALIVAGS